MASQLTASLSPTVALFLLTQAYLIFSYGPLLGRLVGFLLRSNRADIELNVRQCEFAPPEETLEQALEAAKCSSVAANGSVGKESQRNEGEEEEEDAMECTAAVAEHFQGNASQRKAIFPAPAPPASASHAAHKLPKKSDFKASFFSNEGRRPPQPPTDDTNPHASSSSTCSTSGVVSFSNTSITSSLLPSAATTAEVPMDVEQTANSTAPTADVAPVMTIRNWPEFPFLIAFLSTLNSSINTRNSNFVSASASASSTSLANILNSNSSRSNSVPMDEVTISSRESHSSTVVTPTNTSSTLSGGGGYDMSTADPFANSCHSPTVSRSIVELSSADDRLILFTLSLIASILSNKSKDNLCPLVVTEKM